MLLKHKSRFTKKGLIDQKKLKDCTKELTQQWDVRPQDINKPLSEFSGGNQQKFAVGRELWAQPDVLLAAHPTRGVDLGAQDKIHSALLAYSENKKTVVLVSSDLDEVLFLSDRFIILNKNKIYGPFKKNELSPQQIGLYMAGNL
jgi:general nucleoside transport system ATP-binding protein